MNTHLAHILLNTIAYIDPGTGSILLQALIATFVGIAVAVKIFWHRILKFLGIRKTKNINQDDGEENIENNI